MAFYRTEDGNYLDLSSVEAYTRETRCTGPEDYALVVVARSHGGRPYDLRSWRRRYVATAVSSSGQGMSTHTPIFAKKRDRRIFAKADRFIQDLILNVTGETFPDA